MCDYEDIPMKSTDDFYTYNEREKFSPGEIDGYGDDDSGELAEFLAYVNDQEQYS